MNSMGFLINGYDEEQKNNLVSAQRAWIAFKEKYCGDVYNGDYPGREARLIKYHALFRLPVLA